MPKALAFNRLGKTRTPLFVRSLKSRFRSKIYNLKIIIMLITIVLLHPCSTVISK